MLTLEKFKQASEIVKEVTLPTKLVYSEYLSSQTGAEVYLKPENMQYTGAYKVRGAYYKISTMAMMVLNDAALAPMAEFIKFTASLLTPTTKSKLPIRKECSDEMVPI